MENKKTCIVTGGSGFLGSNIVKHMQSVGFRVISIDINEPLDVIENVEYFQCDITEYGDLKSTFDWIWSNYKDVDVLINNAAIDAKVSSNLTKSKNFYVEEFESMYKDFSVSIIGALNCTQIAVNNMLSKKKAYKSVLFIGSDLSVIAPNQRIYIKDGIQTFSKPISYSLIKHAVIGMVKYLAVELGPHNINVNCVSPGPIFYDQPDFLVKNLSAEIPFQRLAKVEEIVGVVEFLTSQKANFITGQNILVDGGRSVW